MKTDRSVHRKATRAGWVFLLVLAGLGMPREAQAKGITLYPTGGYLFFLGGNQEKLEGAPMVGARLEYNFSRDNILSMGLVYGYTKNTIQDSETYPFSSFMEQHFCFLGYRFGRSWRWFSFGSQLGVGAVVRNKTNVPKVFLEPATTVVWEQGTSAQYAMHLGLFASFRPLRWLSIGPDFTYLSSTDLNKWIFGGESSRFFRIGGHVEISF